MPLQKIKSKHNCEFLLIACIDFRFINQHINLPKFNLKNNFDLLSIAGASKQIAQPEDEKYKDFLMKNIDISIKLHGIKKIIIMHHEDCGAYGGSKAFNNKKNELDVHIKDMEKTEKIIKNQFPKIQIIKIFEKINGVIKVLHN